MPHISAFSVTAGDPRKQCSSRRSPRRLLKADHPGAGLHPPHEGVVVDREVDLHARPAVLEALDEIRVHVLGHIPSVVVDVDDHFSIVVEASDSFTSRCRSATLFAGRRRRCASRRIPFQIGNATQFGVMVNCSKDGREQTALLNDAAGKQLRCDANTCLNRPLRDVSICWCSLRRERRRTRTNSDSHKYDNYPP